ncbi:hypothetical protein ACWF9G_03110 [Nocardia sp. NPDC055029]|uniref:hypothetical protein n=1 Tax=Nocardia sp. NPDC060259 TaxID=3347088 RepID=UPI003668EC97
MQNRPYRVHQHALGVVSQCVTVADRLTASMRCLDALVEGVIGEDPTARAEFDHYLVAAGASIASVETVGRRVVAELEECARVPAPTVQRNAVAGQRNRWAGSVGAILLTEHLRSLTALCHATNASGCSAGLAAIRDILADSSPDGRLLRASILRTGAAAKTLQGIADDLLAVAHMFGDALIQGEEFNYS